MRTSQMPDGTRKPSAGAPGFPVTGFSITRASVWHLVGWRSRVRRSQQPRV